MTPYHFTYTVIDRRDFSEKRGAGTTLANDIHHALKSAALAVTGFLSLDTLDLAAGVVSVEIREMERKG